MSALDPVPAASTGLQLPGPDATKDELYTMALSALAQLQSKGREVEQLKRQVEEFEDGAEDGEDNSSAKGHSHKRQTVSDLNRQAQEMERINEFEFEIKRGGKQFCIMRTLWAPSSRVPPYIGRLLTTTVPNNFDLKQRDQIENGELYAHALYLKNMLGPHIVDCITAETLKHVKILIGDVFNGVRSEMVNRINQQCYPNIFCEFIDLDWTTLNNKCGWVPEKRNQGAYWSLLNVEVLNRLEPDKSGGLTFWCGKHSFETMFCSVYMFQVAAALLYGPSGASALIKNKDFPPPLRSVTMAALWELEEVTPKFIAACAIYVLFALSEDKVFGESGLPSNIPYKRHYSSYIKWLYSGLDLGNNDITKLFEEFNNTMFPSGSASTKQRAGGHPQEAKLEESIGRMKASAACKTSGGPLSGGGDVDSGNAGGQTSGSDSD